MSTISSRQAPTPLTYSFGTATGGVWLGLGAGRVAVLGIGLLVSVLALTVGAPVELAVVPVLGGLVMAGARVSGRPLLDWLGPALWHRAAALTGAVGWCGQFPLLSAADQRLRLPAEYGRPRVAQCADDPSIAMITDAATRTVTVVFDVAGVDRFPLLDVADRDALLGGWGHALAVLADTDEALARLQLIERATSPGPAEPEGAVADPAVTDPELAVLSRCIDELATTHTCRLAVQWSFPRLDSKALATVAARCRTVSRSLLTARLLTRPLPTAAVFVEIAAGLSSRVGTGDRSGLPPVSRRSTWTHVLVDDTVHRSYAVSGWPAAAVTADWLDPLLQAAPAGVVRTVAIHLERLAPPAAARAARTTRAKAMLDQRDRARLGMTSSAAIDNAETSGLAMDGELAAGYRTHRLTALVTLSGRNPGALDDAARVMRQAAAAARLDLQPLHGQHDRALAATLPLCRLRPRGQS